MVSGTPPVVITQNERFLSCYTVLLGVRNVTVCFVVPAFNKTDEFLELIQLNDMIVIKDEMRRKCKLIVEWSSVLIPLVADRGLCVRRFRTVTYIRHIRNMKLCRG
jgi:hypothetical protein